ncbi:uncharacterized protein B0T15DRAFT_535032 [Chaetomium strumarium]|uniref:Secreted protein n=1 Tax=Chaetomium strumarium TaxID=1170767 RepID=A0AAJ0LZZ1_9PEZI|nr:hypothetical protein B0T15DRAFT_535032 [Chaetomium strumarium]
MARRVLLLRALLWCADTSTSVCSLSGSSTQSFRTGGRCLEADAASWPRHGSCAAGNKCAESAHDRPCSFESESQREVAP